MNRITSEPFNSLVNASGNILPWLQDTQVQSVWLNWGIAYRDVLILDAFNRPIAKDNLTSHDLGVKANADALKAALLKLAAPVDTDKDGLLDDWELGWFGNLNAAPTADEDGDGADNLAEFVFGTLPKDPTSTPRLAPRMQGSGSTTHLDITFPRFNGGMVDFLVEASSDLVTWTSDPTAVSQVGPPVQRYDGHGTAEVRYQRMTPAGTTGPGFLRVRPVSRLPISP